MGRRRKVIPDPGIELFGRPGARRDPAAGCEYCGGDGWELGPDRAPVEPARRCRCTDPLPI
ncbi:hypothetical protein [Nocardia cyriacigeorgica]|uniref:hypothetical protein n=1 Tax=Nocardia cyriacigeorgica TaxID=135487 RepID=UPI002459018F|nr:hypothetical protein [Nocardia cyriacigeorgica]